MTSCVAGAESARCCEMKAPTAETIPKMTAKAPTRIVLVCIGQVLGLACYWFSRFPKIS